MAPKRKGFTYATSFAFWFERKKARRKRGGVRFEVTRTETFRASNSRGEPKVFDPIVEVEEMRPGDSIEIHYMIEDGNSASLTEKKVTIKLLPPEDS